MNNCPPPLAGEKIVWLAAGIAVTFTHAARVVSPVVATLVDAKPDPSSTIPGIAARALREDDSTGPEIPIVAESEINVA
jgi:hypothetical protein